MNRFRVARGSEEDFQQVWRSRDVYLHELDGFVSFQLLRGPERDDHTLFASQTVWRDFASFEAWTKSEQFRKAHANAGASSTKATYLGHPEFEGFSVVQSVDETGTVIETAA